MKTSTFQVFGSDCLSFSQSDVPVAFIDCSVAESSSPVCVRTMTPMMRATVAACMSDPPALPTS